MIAHYKVVVGFIDSVDESQCEMFETIVNCLDLRLTVPTRDGECTSEIFQISYERLPEIHEIGGIGAKIRVTQVEDRIVLEKENFTLCHTCGDVLLYDEILQDYEQCKRRKTCANGYLSGNCFIVDEYLNFGLNSVEFSIGIKGRVYDCALTEGHACYTFIRSFYQYMRDNRFSNNFHFRGRVSGDKVNLMTLEFDNFY